MREFSICSLSDQSLLIQLADEISKEGNTKVQAVYQYLKNNPIEGIRSITPAFSTVSIQYDVFAVKKHAKSLSAYAYLYNKIEHILDQIEIKTKENKGKIIEVPVCYDEEFALDLNEVSQAKSMSINEVIKRHSEQEYYTYMLGFSPGFPFLGGLDESLEMPRKKTPRTQIPKGSVAIAGKQTGIYSLSSPGGWQIIGKTPLTLYDFEKTPPTLIQMGDTVRFIPIDKNEFNALIGK
ncbi:5-oxoprolinase subunit PxpB [Fangia hongkongensis]|uniref:5-oxoprolinase subunit PxpB n=3 Tax=Fangia hongkongensis TaxID=270495 RepID=UPI000369BD45|nr:5-oxoprolinase subunit PxpB [Fangia hongkongensis]